MRKFFFDELGERLEYFSCPCWCEPCNVEAHLGKVGIGFHELVDVSWRQVLRILHPLCQLGLDFVNETRDPVRLLGVGQDFGLVHCKFWILRLEGSGSLVVMFPLVKQLVDHRGRERIAFFVDKLSVFQKGRHCFLCRDESLLCRLSSATPSGRWLGRFHFEYVSVAPGFFPSLFLAVDANQKTEQTWISTLAR